MNWRLSIVGVLMWYVLYCNSLISEPSYAFCATWRNEVNCTQRGFFFSFNVFLKAKIKQ